MLDSPILWLAGGVILIGGTWYAIRKWTGAGDKCLDKKTLAEVVESVLHGSKTSAEARKLAGALEKDGCAAADVKSIRDAADARDAKDKCPSPTDLDARIAQVKAGTLAFANAETIAAKWAADGCATEAAKLRDAVKAATPVVPPLDDYFSKIGEGFDPGGAPSTLPPMVDAPKPFVELLSKLPKPKLGGASGKAALPGWPAVKELPQEYFDLVHPVVAQFNYAKVWEAAGEGGIYPGKSAVCPGGGDCRWQDLALASSAIRDTKLGPVGAPIAISAAVRAAAADELGKAAERVQFLANDGLTGWKTAGVTGHAKMPPYLRRRVA